MLAACIHLPTWPADEQWLRCDGRARLDVADRLAGWLQVLGGEGPAPAHCTPAIMHAIIQQHLDCAAIFTILPLQARLAACGCRV